MNRPVSLLRFLLVLVALLAAGGARAAASATDTWMPARTGVEDLTIGQMVPATAETTALRYAPGDDARWAQPDWDDSGWETAAKRRIPSHTGIFWVRIKFRDASAPLPPGLLVDASMAYDLYWDGRLIGRSGQPANEAAQEVPGVLGNVFTLDDLARGPGEHVLALRVSNYRNRFSEDTMPFTLLALSPAEYLAHTDRENVRSAAVVGAGVILAFAGLVVWLLVDRRPVLLLLAGLCLGASVMQALFIARFVFGYTYDWHYHVWVAQVAALNLFGLCLVSIVIVHFRLPRWTWIPVLLTPCVGQLAWLWAFSTRLVLPLLLLQALLFSLWAVGRRQRGALLVAGGVAGTSLMWVVDRTHFLSPAFLTYFVPTLVGITFAVALTLRDEKRRAQQAQLTAARLEIELLKKNLQPHFLLNTLTAVSEVIEQDPSGAVKLIDDLAVEFRSLALMAGERLVPLRRELELCRAHLKVLGRRTGRRLDLSIDGVDEDSLVPPALFLTLIENSLVHQRLVDGAVFRLTAQTPSEGENRYTFLSAGAVKSEINRSAGGTGLRYVRARLEESFPGHWSLDHGPVADGWRTVVTWRAVVAGGVA